MTEGNSKSHGSSAAPDVREWQETRKQTIYDESCRVLDAQREMLSDIDEKAMRTVRLTAVLIGVFVAGARVTGTGVFDPFWATTGIGLLFCSVVLGAATYNESDEFALGPSKTYVEQLTADRIVGRSWDDDYLMSIAYWIGENYDVLWWNSWLLTGTRICFVLGLAAMLLAIAL